MLLLLFVTLSSCPARIVDAHHPGTVEWSGMVETPAHENDGLGRRTAGTPRCLYFHEYRDQKGRKSMHRLELRLRDGDIFHDAWLLPESQSAPTTRNILW